MRLSFICAVATLVAASPSASAQVGHFSQNAAKAQLGKVIFFDSSLSEPRGQACATCHQPASGFNGNGDARMAVFPGAVVSRFGLHNPPSVAYAFLSPAPGYYTVDDEIVYMGGQFWDGRAADMADQAKGPFLNPDEMNTNKAAVADKVCSSAYAPAFRAIYGWLVCDSADKAFDAIADALASYETSSEVNTFSSK